ncbi:helix-turn-helix domain-containing protein [Aeromonas caviae]|jgi:AcrR family transcriptional regulator|uniref:TetR/AcrR family transcriptional regulator n=1 Tax=Aeromonas TaxID=642 RepID=UPI00084D386E|nr:MULTISPECIES: TetR/AcrR family transcriptional regulator [Aeromonas]MBL0529812.1 TetR/AcrR family transcriptional regulator [Aeromonas caviae]MBP4061189.1 TetR/AcrR family transcriptional regulator [Aeromonas sp. Prich7-2]MDX7726689.1 helix-turn-helix domain-containing protein [Aeromonas caviae]OCW46717.1 TetR family transcriptional regulator [Aeromonas caviae]OEG02076.1 TetR family transcriptional regulator [Aeromonas caviae]
MSDKRQQLMTTAYRLFNRHGFHATGIDRIWAEAGSTKRTLYRHFPTKDALIEAVLMARDAEFFALLDARMDGVSGREARLLALLDGFADWFGRSDFYGCNFINASAEFSDPRHPVRKLVVAHKRALLNWVRKALECTEVQATGLCLLLEGAVVMAHSYQQPLALEQARVLAEAVLAEPR